MSLRYSMGLLLVKVLAGAYLSNLMSQAAGNFRLRVLYFNLLPNPKGIYLNSPDSLLNRTFHFMLQSL
jgi:hypothetical protein